jgi:hypothetical protein
VLGTIQEAPPGLQMPAGRIAALAASAKLSSRLRPYSYAFMEKGHAASKTYS